MDVGILKQISQPSIKVERNSRGYTWEIKIYGDDIDEILRKIKETDDKLKVLYPAA